MDIDTKHGGRRGLYLAAAATAVLLLAGVLLLVAGLPGQGPPQPTGGRVSAASGTSPSPTEAATAQPAPSVTSSADAETDLGPILAASRPVSLTIPSIGVHSTTLVDLGYTKDGELEVPKDFDLPGWFTPGPTPGQFGPAVIAGHVDSKAGPAVFYRLGALKAGDRVTVGRADGSTATFRVDRVARYAKDAFPTAEVYGNTTNRAELRLITCGGTFDRRTGHYVDNVVAYAHLTG